MIAVSNAVLRFDAPVMIGAAIAYLPLFFTGNVISHKKIVVFLGYYIAYRIYLILDSTDHSALPVFSMAMLMFVLPITVLTIGTIVGEK